MFLVWSCYTIGSTIPSQLEGCGDYMTIEREKFAKKPVDINEFLNNLSELSSQDKVFVEKLNPKNPEDADIILRIALRGKTKREYRQIVNGLIHYSHNLEDKEREDEIYKLTLKVIILGEDIHGLIWT